MEVDQEGFDESAASECAAASGPEPDEGDESHQDTQADVEYAAAWGNTNRGADRGNTEPELDTGGRSVYLLVVG